MATLETVYRVDSSALKRAQVDLRNFEKVNIRTFQSAVGHMKRMANTSDYAFNQLGRAATRAQVRTKRFASVGLQQVGYQVGDFAVQLQGGTNAAVAFGQQGSQLLGIFGPLGAILGAVLAIMTAFAAPLLDSAEGASQMNDEFAKLKDQLKPIAPLLNSIKDGFIALKEFALDSINFVVNNLDRLVVYATTAASFFAVKWVGAMLVGKVATLGFRGALIALGATFRAVMLRTVLGAALVGMGEMVYRFTLLVDGAGGFGNALKLLGDVAKAVWDGIGKSAKALIPALKGVWKSIQASFIGMLETMTEKWARFLGDLGAGLSNVPGMGGIGESVMRSSGNMLGTLAELNAAGVSASNQAASAFGEAANIVRDSFAGVQEPLDKLMEAYDKAKDKFDGEDFEIRNLFKDAEDAIEDTEDAMGSLGKTAEKVADGPLDKYRKKLQEALDPEKNYVTSMKALQSSLADFIFDPFDKGVKGMVLSFSNALRRMASEAIAAKIMQSIVGPVGSGASSGIGGFLASFLGMANGGAFNNGRVTPFASGGVVNGPTVFPMANGMGLMGEAGPEAVMPLKRDKSGRLGVEAQGAQMEAPQIKVVNIDDRASIGEYLEGPAGEKVVMNVLRRNGVVNR